MNILKSGEKDLEYDSNPVLVHMERKVCTEMKGKFLELVKKSSKLKISVVAAIAVVIGCIGIYEYSQVPELPIYTADPVIAVTIEEEEVPLASKSTTTTKTSKSVSTKTETLSKKSTKTYTKSLGTTTKTTTKTTKNTAKTVKTQTTVKTTQIENYYKNKKYKKVTTTKLTTVKTTTTTANTIYEVSIDKIAPKMNVKIRNAFTTLGFKVYIDNSVNYAGYFDAKNRAITLKAEDDTIYHELGHFLAFVSGNTDTTSSFKSIYNAEKSKYKGTNKSYVIQNSSEYFAESVKEYVLSGASLKNSRPKTYAAITSAINKVTTTQVNKVKMVYAVCWS